MIEEAMRYYAFREPKVNFIRHNENMTYKIIDTDEVFLMRIHKPVEGFNLDILRAGHQQLEYVSSEIELLRWLYSLGEITIQSVVANRYGEDVTILDDGTPVTVLRWIDGISLEETDATPLVALEIGRVIGRLHTATKTHVGNHYQYDEDLITRMEREIDNAASQGHFDRYSYDVILNTLKYIKEYLINSVDRYILVHADLGRSNLICHDETISPIDFSLCGYCIPEMDIASVFAHIEDIALRQLVLQGYRASSETKIYDIGVEVCFCFQILLFAIGQYRKYSEETWFKERVHSWCEQYFIKLTTKKKDDDTPVFISK